jgi:hypothetical protein
MVVIWRESRMRAVMGTLLLTQKEYCSNEHGDRWISMADLWIVPKIVAVLHRAFGLAYFSLRDKLKTINLLPAVVHDIGMTEQLCVPVQIHDIEEPHERLDFDPKFTIVILPR